MKPEGSEMKGTLSQIDSSVDKFLPIKNIFTWWQIGQLWESMTILNTRKTSEKKKSTYFGFCVHVLDILTCDITRDKIVGTQNEYNIWLHLRKSLFNVPPLTTLLTDILKSTLRALNFNTIVWHWRAFSIWSSMKNHTILVNEIPSKVDEKIITGKEDPKY